MDREDLVVVAGAGGFIGGHLVKHLVERGHTQVRAIDVKPLHEWHQVVPEAESRLLDLRERIDAGAALQGARYVFNLAADMGGMGFIETNRALCMLSVLINTHLLLAAAEQEVDRYFYASSACVYAAGKQDSYTPEPLAEADAYPAMPEDGYGWEKLFSERMCRHFREDYRVPTRIARYHNVYGPLGTWTGGREKAPAAICRKVAEAVIRGDHTIKIWGDGRQARSFTFIDDCLEGTVRLTESDYGDPLNIGSSELVSIDGLVDVVEEIAGVTLARTYEPDAPRGVNGRNSDNTLVRAVLDWEPSTSLRHGLEVTYRWVYDQVKSGSGVARPVTRALSTIRQ
jgi:nucleoside-diphosphate-sugar epimerase